MLIPPLGGEVNNKINESYNHYATVWLAMYFTHLEISCLCKKGRGGTAGPYSQVELQLVIIFIID